MTIENMQATIAFIPFAGGSHHAFRSIQKRLPTCIESIGIDYARHRGGECDAPSHTVDRMVEQAIEQIRQAKPSRLILFGYSLGAIVAYEVSKRYSELPCAISRLVVAACRPPHLFQCDQVNLQSSDDEFLRSIATFGVIPDFLFENHSARRYLLPKLKRDFFAAKRYRYGEFRKLPISLSTICGQYDEFAPSCDVDAWEEHFSALFNKHRVSGGHLFHESHADQLADILTAEAQIEIDS